MSELTYYKTRDLSHVSSSVLRAYIMAFEGRPSSDIDILPNNVLRKMVQKAEAARTKVTNPKSVELVFGVDRTVSGLGISRFIRTNLVDCDNPRCSAVEVLKLGQTENKKSPTEPS